jgi:hypothetical protein
MLIKNQKNKRNLIEEELKKIPKDDQNNLIILMKCLFSDYVEQKIEVKIIKKQNKENVLQTINKDIKSFDGKFEIYSPSLAYPEIWYDFDNNPFYITCDICNNIINSRGKSFKTYTDDCKICKNKKYQDYISEISDTENKTLIPIKRLIDKYREYHRTNNSDKWIRNMLACNYGSILCIQKLKNRWVCSQERTEFIDFKKMSLIK